MKKFVDDAHTGRDFGENIGKTSIADGLERGSPATGSARPLTCKKKKLAAMNQENGLDSEIQECLARLDISSPVDWDVLAFVYRHKVTLANADQIAHMLGYPSTTVGDALDHLETLKLIRRSRASQGARVYQFVNSEVASPFHSCFQRLIEIGGDPAGRVSLMKALRQRRTEMTSRAGKGGKSA